MVNIAVSSASTTAKADMTTATVIAKGAPAVATKGDGWVCVYGFYEG